MSNLVQPAVLIRLAQAYAAAHPSGSGRDAIDRAKALIESLRSVGLEVVYSDWAPTDAPVKTVEHDWDPFLEGMKVIYEQNKDRQPWRP